ncbi:Cysteine synthase 2 [Coemansia sp. RSA 1836]|nr:Cysteine synthase 2 [Coemansia sp. RSA 1836]
MDRCTASTLALCAAAGAVVAGVATRWLLLLAAPPPPTTKDAADEEEVVVVDGVTGLIGNTPLVRIASLSAATGCEVLGKAEFLNPGGSSKDRVALHVIEAAEAAGQLTPGACIFEGTSGSTGISLAMVACARGYACHIVMPSDQAVEKSQLLERYGATVERVPPCSIVDPGHFVNVARRRAMEATTGGYFVDQFESPLNFDAHARTTGPEILRQTRGRVDAFVHGAGTGGTLAGVTWFLKRHAKSSPSSPSPSVRCYLADPQGSGLANRVNHGVLFAATEREGTRRRQQVDTLVEGIGLNRLTRNFARVAPVLDGAISVSDADAVRMARWLMAKDGQFVGSSAAVNCVAALSIARSLGPGHTIVTILADSGHRHLTKFWNDDAMARIGHSTAVPESLDEFAQLL